MIASLLTLFALLGERADRTLVSAVSERIHCIVGCQDSDSMRYHAYMLASVLAPTCMAERRVMVIKIMRDVTGLDLRTCKDLADAAFEVHSAEVAQMHTNVALTAAHTCASELVGFAV